jgi:hypothetical protein
MSKRATSVTQIIFELLEALSKENLYALKARAPKTSKPEVVQKLRKEAAADWRQEKTRTKSLSFFAEVKQLVTALGYTVENPQPGKRIVNKFGEEVQDYDMIASIEAPLSTPSLVELRSDEVIKTFILSDKKTLEFIDQIRTASSMFKKSESHTPSLPAVVYTDAIVTLSYDHKTFLLTAVFSLEDLRNYSVGRAEDALRLYKEALFGLADYGRSVEWGVVGKNPMVTWYADAKSILKSLNYHSCELVKGNSKLFVLDGKVVVGDFHVVTSKRYDLVLDDKDIAELPIHYSSNLSPYHIIQFMKEDEDAASLLTGFSRFSTSLLGGNGQNVGSLDQYVLYKDDALEVEFMSRAQHIRFVVTITFGLNSLKEIPKPALLPKFLNEFNGVLSKFFVYFKEWFKSGRIQKKAEPDYDSSVEAGLPSKTWKDHVAKERELAKGKPSDIHAVVKSLAADAA